RDGKWQFLIANVATIPQYRRQGIARKLTQTALKYIREHNGTTAWLQVREENSDARDLYSSLGFQEIASRTTYRASKKTFNNQPPDSNIFLTNRRSSDWPSQKAWLQATYPPEIAWHLPFDTRNLEPGIWHSLMQFVQDEPVYHWSARRGERLLGVASLEINRGNTDNLWLAFPVNLEENALFALLTRVRAESLGNRPIAVNFPSGIAERCFHLAGFEKHLTLVWMNQPMHQGQTTQNSDKLA
ncbi:MAG TPA: N-acetyltransferase, partial [Leptolinea sp.]